MTAQEYETYVRDNRRLNMDMAYAVVGLNEEAGEVAGWYKKVELRQSSLLTPQDLKEELGDVIYYVTRIAQIKGWTLGEIMEANQAKCKSRGFKPEEPCV